MAPEVQYCVFQLCILACLVAGILDGLVACLALPVASRVEWVGVVDDGCYRQEQVGIVDVAGRSRWEVLMLQVGAGGNC